MVKLGERTHGYEFSGIEYTLIYNSDNMGFVRYVPNSKQYFYLDPSPFLHDQVDKVYLLENTNAPTKRKLIRITHSEEEIRKIASGDKTQNLFFKNYIIIHVKGWEYVNPNNIFRRRNIYPDEYVNFFSNVFTSELHEDMIEPIGHTMAIYTVSSPVIGGNNKGGINTAVNYGSNNDLWKKTKSLLKVIPNEFLSTRSELFYKYGGKEETLNPMGSTEVSLAFDNPKRLAVQMPLSLIKMELTNSNLVSMDYDHLLPFMIAYNLDALLFTPELPDNLTKHMEESVYNLIEEINQTETLGYNQDIGMALPKISASIARLNFEPEITKKHIDKALDTWFSSFEHAMYNASKDLHRDDIHMKEGTKTLYHWLVDNYGYMTDILETEIYEKKPIPIFMIDEALEDLLNKGAAYSPKNGIIRVLEFKRWQED